jgi:hypothetical protein
MNEKGNLFSLVEATDREHSAGPMMISVLVYSVTTDKCSQVKAEQETVEAEGPYHCMKYCMFKLYFNY